MVAVVGMLVIYQQVGVEDHNDDAHYYNYHHKRDAEVRAHIVELLVNLKRQIEQRTQTGNHIRYSHSLASLLFPLILLS